MSSTLLDPTPSWPLLNLAMVFFKYSNVCTFTWLCHYHLNYRRAQQAVTQKQTTAHKKNICWTQQEKCGLYAFHLALQLRKAAPSITKLRLFLENIPMANARCTRQDKRKEMHKISSSVGGTGAFSHRQGCQFGQAQNQRQAAPHEETREGERGKSSRLVHDKPG